MNTRMRPALLISALALLAAVSATPRIASADDPKTFRMIVGEPRYMDPNLATDFSIFVNAQLFQPLARLNKDGSLTMQQAKSIELAPDGRTWTITLNPDYKWSNGQPITAADWVYSWKRILDPKTGSEVAVFLSDIENADDYNKGKITDFSKVGIKATGDYTFQVVTTGLAPQFRAKLALPYLTPVPKAVVEKFGDKWIAPENVVTNGPYKLIARVNDQSITMEANPYYGGKKPAIQHIQMTVASGDVCAAQLRAFEADEVDFVTCLPSQDIARVQGDATLKSQLNPFPLAATEWLQYDMSRAPWTDKRVRHALALAIDKKQIVAAVSNDTANVALTLVPESIPGGNSADALKGIGRGCAEASRRCRLPRRQGLPALHHHDGRDSRPAPRRPDGAADVGGQSRHPGDDQCPGGQRLPRLGPAAEDGALRHHGPGLVVGLCRSRELVRRSDHQRLPQEPFLERGIRSPGREGQRRAGSREAAGDLPGRQQDPGGRAADDGL